MIVTPMRNYKELSPDELRLSLRECFAQFNGKMGLRAVVKTLIKRLHIDANNLGESKVMGVRNLFTEKVSLLIEEFCAKGTITQVNPGEWKFNHLERIKQVYGDVPANPDINVHELTHIGRLQKIIMIDIFATLGELRIGKDDLIGLVTISLPDGVSPNSIPNALTSLSSHGWKYLDTTTTRGIVAVTAKGAEAIKTGIYNFQKKPTTSGGDIKKAIPLEQIEVAIVYILAISDERSLSANEILMRCANIFFSEHAKKMVGEHTYDPTPFSRYVKSVLREMCKCKFVQQPMLTADINQITQLGWITLKKKSKILNSLGFEIPTTVPKAILSPFEKVEVEALKAVHPLKAPDESVVAPDPEIEEVEDDLVHPRFVNGSTGNHSLIATPAVKAALEDTIRDRKKTTFLTNGVQILDTTKVSSKKIIDPVLEAKAMSGIAEILESLNEATQKRVLNWINERYENQ